VSDRCRSCNAAIIWATTENGKSMPLDAAPVAQVGVFMFDNGYAKAPPKVYRSHFATCPNADQHRKR
jgi:hypothetical protein